MTRFQFHNPVRIVYGAGELGRIGSLPEVSGKRCLAICYDGFDPGLVDAKRIGAKSVETLDRFEANPTVSFVREVSDLVVEKEFDAIIAIGGGSSIDTAKAAAYLAANPGWRIGDPPSGRTACPVIAVPSTAGTGSEVSPYAILTDETGLKKILSDPAIFPAVAVCDPELTTGLPPRVTADSGVDAISHVIEAYLNVKCGGYMKALAVDALELAREALPAVLQDGGSIDSRDAMMSSALEGGLLLAACGTVVVHAMGYGLSGLWGLTHGFANGLLLARFVEVVADKGDSRAQRILSIFGDDLRGFISKSGITVDPETHILSDESLESVVELGMNSYGLSKCVVPLDREDIREILVSSLRA